jgi:hypothetical protein
VPFRLADDEAESWSSIEPLLIVSLDAIPPKPPGNGAAKKRPKS